MQKIMPPVCVPGYAVKIYNEGLTYFHRSMLTNLHHCQMGAPETIQSSAQSHIYVAMVHPKYYTIRKSLKNPRHTLLPISDYGSVSHGQGLFIIFCEKEKYSSFISALKIRTTKRCLRKFVKYVIAHCIIISKDILLTKGQ